MSADSGHGVRTLRNSICIRKVFVTPAEEQVADMGHFGDPIHEQVAERRQEHVKLMKQ